MAATQPQPGHGFGFALERHPLTPARIAAGSDRDHGALPVPPGAEQPVLTEPFLTRSRPSPPGGSGTRTLPPGRRRAVGALPRAGDASSLPAHRLSTPWQVGCKIQTFTRFQLEGPLACSVVGGTARRSSFAS